MPKPQMRTQPGQQADFRFLRLPVKLTQVADLQNCTVSLVLRHQVCGTSLQQHHHPEKTPTFEA